jgi:hypothetical protein
LRPWHERYEGLLERELAAFEKEGFKATVTSGPPNSLDVVVGVLATIEGREFGLIVNYPDSYPFLRPHVMLEGDVFDRHQNPVDKNLCLLDRSTRAWRTSMTAASHIAEQLPKLLATLDAEPDERKGLEAPQGEPLTAFLRHVSGSVVLLPNLDAETAEAGAGCGVIRLLDANHDLTEAPLRGVAATLTERADGGKKKYKPLGKANDELLARAHGDSVEYRWVRVVIGAGDLAGDGSAERLLAIATEQKPDLAVFDYKKAGAAEVAVLGLVFEEEVELDQRADAWSFLVSVRRPASDFLYLVRGERASASDMLARIPSLVGLGDKTVALVGLGALGSPAALELARTQIGTLKVLDFDWVEYGTTVRWLTGIDAVMQQKTSFVKAVVNNNYPYVNVEESHHMLGAPVGQGDKPEREVLAELFDGTDLLLDLTAERGINYLLTRLAHERGIPQIIAWGTEGAWGGAVVRITPGVTGCWFCLLEHLDDGTIPTPPHDEAGTVQPQGCASATFTGTNFDLLPIVAQAVRLSAQTLLRDTPDSYPDSSKDVMILDLRDDHGLPITPKWTDYSLNPHRKCPYCQGEFT